jgi:fucose permease
MRGIHYGWIIVFAGVLTIVAALGLGRFSLGMLLPSMGKDLELSYSLMGYIGTGNFIGYLLGVLVSSRLVKRFGYRAVISSGIFLVGGSMILVGKANGLVWLVSARPGSRADGVRHRSWNHDHRLADSSRQ